MSGSSDRPRWPSQPPTPAPYDPYYEEAATAPPLEQVPQRPIEHNSQRHQPRLEAQPQPEMYAPAREQRREKQTTGTPIVPADLMAGLG